MHKVKLPKKRKILLMYITKVSGHRQATMAIQRSLRSLSSNVEAPSINGFGYTYPVLEKVVNRAYMSVIKRTPKVWDYIYDNPKVVKNSELLILLSPHIYKGEPVPEDVMKTYNEIKQRPMLSLPKDKNDD